MRERSTSQAEVRRELPVDLLGPQSRPTCYGQAVVVVGGDSFGPPPSGLNREGVAIGSLVIRIGTERTDGTGRDGIYILLNINTRAHEDFVSYRMGYSFRTDSLRSIHKLVGG